jgi:hypothetical protein
MPAWQLDLGGRDSARVRLNGRDLGSLVGPRFLITFESALLDERNVLEVDVTNRMANRVADLDRRGVPWKKFYNVNFPARLPENRGPDGLFTAVRWEPLDSGLLGPVTLQPVRVSGEGTSVRGQKGNRSGRSPTATTPTMTSSGSPIRVKSEKR